MNRIPWKTIVFSCLAIVVLIVMRSAVTIGKSIYYGFDWYYDLVADPWFYAGIAVAGVGILTLAVMGIMKICSRVN